MGGTINDALRIRVAETQPLRGEASYDALIDEIVKERDDPPSGDIGTSFLCDAILWARERNRVPAVDAVLGEFAMSRQTITQPWTVEGSPAANAAARVRAAVQRAAMRDTGRYEVPQTPLGWKRKVRRIFEDDALVEIVREDLKDPVHTARRSRYGPIEVARQEGAFANFIDMGCSVPEGPWQLQLKGRFPFTPIDFRFRNGERDYLATQGYANLVGRPALAGDIVISDLTSPDDARLQELSFAAMRQSEIMNPGERLARRRLAMLGKRLGNILFIQADVTDRNTMAELREHCAGQDFRLACLVTVLHEVGQENVRRAIDNMLGLLADHHDSQLIIAEHGQVERRGRSSISLLPRWARGTYSYFAVAKHDPKRIVQHLYTFDTSRPSSGIVEAGLFRAGGEVWPMRDYLVRAAAQVAIEPAERFLQPLYMSP